MTDDELATWREKSERLRLLTIAMDPSETRAAAAFAAGAMMGLANRLKACEDFPRPFVIGYSGDVIGGATATIARKIYLTEGIVTHLERMKARLDDLEQESDPLAELVQLLDMLQIK